MRKPAPLTVTEWQRSAKLRLRETNDALIEVHKNRKLTRRAIADTPGFGSSGTITHWENLDNSNMPDGYRLYLYHYHFGVTAEWLIREDASKLELELWEALQKIRSERDAT